MKYELVVTDIDGTLVDDDKQVSEVTSRYIDKFREKGGLFTIATGRGEKAARPFIEKLHIDIPAIIFNGGELYHSETGPLYVHYLDKNIFNLVIDCFLGTDLGIVTYHRDRIFISDYKPPHDLYMAQERVDVERVPDIKEVDEVNKILLVGDVGKAKQLIRNLEVKNGIKINHVQTEDVYLEVIPDGVSKGEGLKELCSYLGVPIEKTVAIGDHMNDIDMIMAAGCGIAVENAMDEVKKIAKFVTKRNTEDGVAHVLKKVLNL